MPVKIRVVGWLDFLPFCSERHSSELLKNVVFTLPPHPTKNGSEEESGDVPSKSRIRILLQTRSPCIIRPLPVDSPSQGRLVKNHV